MIQKNKYLAGLITPNVLETIEKEPTHPFFLDLDNCTALEIRYDLFKSSLWENLAQRVKRIAPHVLQIGTIRLKRDGGNFENYLEKNRLSLWKKILEAEVVPHWLDLEQDCLKNYKDLNSLCASRGCQILISQHNFTRVPQLVELLDFKNDILRLHGKGLKIAAMCPTETDADRLYEFTEQCSSEFELFSAFGMGSWGKVSRIWSLKEGANLTYGAIEKALAPGQIDIFTMSKAIKNLENFHSKFEISSFLCKK